MDSSLNISASKLVGSDVLMFHTIMTCVSASISHHITSYPSCLSWSIMVYHGLSWSWPIKPPRVSKSQNMSESTHLVTSGSKGPKVRQNVSKFCCKQVDRHDTTLLAVPWRAISMRGALCVTFASRSLDELECSWVFERLAGFSSAIKRYQELIGGISSNLAQDKVYIYICIRSAIVPCHVLLIWSCPNSRHTSMVSGAQL